jgi:hypothetical protein
VLNDPEGYHGVFKVNNKPNINLINSDNIVDLCHYRESVKKDPIISMVASYLEITE